MSSSQAITLQWLSLQTVQTCPILFDLGSIVSMKHVCVLTCYALVGLVCFSSMFSSPYGNMCKSRLGYIWTIRRKTSVYGDVMTTSACLPIESMCPRLLYSLLCVSRVDGTQVVPLVSVPDITMNFFNLFVVPLL